MTPVIVWVGRLSDGVPGLSGRIHNIVDGSRVPCHTIILLYRINHLSVSYDNFHPESHNILVEAKEVWASPGTCVPVWLPWEAMGYLSCLCVYIAVSLHILNV